MPDFEQKKRNNPKVGEDIKNSTIWVLGLGFLILAIMIYFGVKTESIALPLVGVGILCFCILCTLPNLIAFFRGKRRERLIKQGKLVEEHKKSFSPNNRWGDDDK